MISECNMIYSQSSLNLSRKKITPTAPADTYIRLDSSPHPYASPIHSFSTAEITQSVVASSQSQPPSVISSSLNTYAIRPKCSGRNKLSVPMKPSKGSDGHNGFKSSISRFLGAFITKQKSSLSSSSELNGHTVGDIGAPLSEREMQFETEEAIDATSSGSGNCCVQPYHMRPEIQVYPSSPSAFVSASTASLTLLQHDTMTSSHFQFDRHPYAQEQSHTSPLSTRFPLFSNEGLSPSAYGTSHQHHHAIKKSVSTPNLCNTPVPSVPSRVRKGKVRWLSADTSREASPHPPPRFSTKARPPGSPLTTTREEGEGHGRIPAPPSTTLTRADTPPAPIGGQNPEAYSLTALTLSRSVHPFIEQDRAGVCRVMSSTSGADTPTDVSARHPSPRPAKFQHQEHHHIRAYRRSSSFLHRLDINRFVHGPLSSVDELEVSHFIEAASPSPATTGMLVHDDRSSCLSVAASNQQRLSNTVVIGLSDSDSDEDIDDDSDYDYKELFAKGSDAIIPPPSIPMQITNNQHQVELVPSTQRSGMLSATSSASPISAPSDFPQPPSIEEDTIAEGPPVTLAAVVSDGGSTRL